MNLDELRSVQSKERSKDSLQHLRESFYSDVGEYIRGLREERERAAERASDPFDSAEVNQLTDEIQTAEEVVEAVYERRVGKVVKRASLAAAGIPADEEGLTSEEQVLFSDLVERIESNKTTVLDVLAGDESAAVESDTAETETRPSPGAEPEPNPASDDRPSAEAATIAGDDEAERPASDANTTTPSEPASPAPSAREPDPAATEADGSASVAPDSAEADSTPSNAPETSANGGDDATDTTPGSTPEARSVSESQSESEPELPDDRTTVRITQDVGSILGVDEREYDLSTEDVVALPTQNAGPLIERDAAEKLD